MKRVINPLAFLAKKLIILYCPFFKSLKKLLAFLFAFIDTADMSYPGGKGGVFHKLINLMPPHEIYIETHLGSGAVIRNKRLAQRNIRVPDIMPVSENNS